MSSGRLQIRCIRLVLHSRPDLDVHQRALNAGRVTGARRKGSVASPIRYRGGATPLPDRPMLHTDQPPGFADILAAADRLRGHSRDARRCSSSPRSNERVGGAVLVKAETAAAHRLVQVPRRLQRRGPGAAAAGGRRLLLRQPRPGRGRGGAACWAAGDHRHAGRRAGDQARQHAGAGRRGRPLRPLPRGPRGDRRARSPPSDGAALVRPFDDPRHHRRPGHRRAGDRRAGAARRMRLDAAIVCRAAAAA